MKRLSTITLLAIVIFTGCQPTSQWDCPEIVATEGIIAAGAELVEVSDKFVFTEGPATDPAGNVYFTDQPNNQIMIYTTAGNVERYMRPAGRANGLYFDAKGNLIACADENNELWRIHMGSRKHTMLARMYEGIRLNGPNDAWVHPTGRIYFTDPYYQRPWWQHKKQPQPIRGVYFLSADESKMVLVDDRLTQPNGIIGTPDGKTLYVSDIDDHKTYQYTIREDGKLIDKKLFCKMGSDGMTIDCCGNVYLTGKGVTVFDQYGKQIEHIDVPRNWTANVTFGGKDRNVLFITAGKAIYTLQMNVTAAQ